MRKAGRVVAEMHEETRRAIKPGVTTAQLDKVARAVIDKRGASSNFLGYHGFPATLSFDGLPPEHAWKLVGNSVPVPAVAHVLSWIPV